MPIKKMIDFKEYIKTIFNDMTYDSSSIIEPEAVLLINTLLNNITRVFHETPDKTKIVNTFYRLFGNTNAGNLIIAGAKRLAMIFTFSDNLLFSIKELGYKNGEKPRYYVFLSGIIKFTAITILDVVLRCNGVALDVTKDDILEVFNTHTFIVVYFSDDY
jgi:hypothetical protein